MFKVTGMMLVDDMSVPRHRWVTKHERAYSDDVHTDQVAHMRWLHNHEFQNWHVFVHNICKITKRVAEYVVLSGNPTKEC